MAQVRLRRIERQIREELASLLKRGEVRDPRLAELMLVTAVEVARDLAHAKVWISYYGERERLASGIAALNHAAGFIQGLLARRLPLRVFPKLRFVADESMERGFRIVGKLRNLAT